MFNRNFNAQWSSQPSGTLQSQGMFYQPPLPNMGTPKGTGVADNRAYTRTMQPGETAEHRLNQMTAKPSEYMQNASRRGLEQAASRGMLNSSMAAGASQRAALEAAMPIAEADAGRVFTAGSQNLEAMNQNLMQERDIANRVLMNREGLANSEALAELEANTRRYGIDIGLLGDREQRAYGGEQAGLGRAHEYGMSQLGQQQQLERMGYGSNLENWLQDQGLGRDMSRMDFGSQLQDWNAAQNWRRGMYGDMLNMYTGGAQGLSMNLLAMMQESPDIYTPEVVQGLSNFMGQAGSAMFGNIFNQIGPIIDQIFGGGG
jgi:hypothetical protein